MLADLLFRAGITQVVTQSKIDAESTGKALAHLQDTVDKMIEPLSTVMSTTLLSKIEANNATVPQRMEDAMIQRLDALERQLISRIEKAQNGIDVLRDTHSLVSTQDKSDEIG